MPGKIKVVPVSEVNRLSDKTIMNQLGIEFTEITESYVRAKMPVDARTHQVYGILHGGASVVLAETIGSVGSMLTIDTERFRCVGVDINANHVRAVSSGFVIGTGKPLHLGSTTQVWEILLHTEEQKLVCVSRLTVAVVPKDKITATR
jgi:1,4-dihydroxy-2-naphthoyl-CoA hydrolase